MEQQQFHRDHPALSVLHQIRDAHPVELDLSRLKGSHREATSNGVRRPFDRQTCFLMMARSKVLLCTANELSIIGIPWPRSSVHGQLQSVEDAPSEFMVHRRARSEDENPLSLFSSFFGSASLDRSEPAYCCMATHEPVASRTIIGCADNAGHLELYLLSGAGVGGSGGGGSSVHSQVVDRQSVSLPFVPPGGGEQDGLSLLIHGYAPRDGVCWFSVLLFYAVKGKGGGAVLQCAYKKSTDKLELRGHFEPLHGIPAQNVDRLDAAIYDRTLWCGVVSSSDGHGGAASGNGSDYDVFFCDIGHYLDKYHRRGGTAASAQPTKWKFQRMWKRSEYISRSLQGIEMEFKFESFWQQFAASLDRVECASSRDVDRYKHRVHELVLHFWCIRLLDDPSLELAPSILEQQLQRMADQHQLGPLCAANTATARWNGHGLATLGLLADADRGGGGGRGGGVGGDRGMGMEQRNETMRRIEFESKLQGVIISVMERRRCEDAERGYGRSRGGGDGMDLDGGHLAVDEEAVRSKEFMQSVWTEYSQYFRSCLEAAKSCWKWTGMGSVALLGPRGDRSVVIMKQNGFSVLRRMDYAEQIEVYFDRCQDESDELTAFDEPPIRLHKFVAWCQRTRVGGRGQHRLHQVFCGHFDDWNTLHFLHSEISNMPNSEKNSFD